jgi:DNA-binding MarR family transcriptional regulator
MDQSSQVDPKQMLELSANLRRMAEAMLPPQEPALPDTDLGYVRSIIRARRLRDHFFSAGLFADPAWDMLLELYAARLERQAVTVSGLCIASSVPSTTALRWVKSLCARGLLVRKADEQDSRKVIIELSDQAVTALISYLAAARRASELAT